MDDSRMAATCDGIMARRADVARTPFFAMSVTGTKQTCSTALTNVRFEGNNGRRLKCGYRTPTRDWMIACITGGQTALPIILILSRRVPCWK